MHINIVLFIKNLKNATVGVLCNVNVQLILYLIKRKICNLFTVS